jgi:hypothetical protein
MIFAHADYAVSTAVHDKVGVAKVGLWSHWFWSSLRLLAVDSLVKEVRKVDCAINDGECTASILMNTCANVKWS